jgi:hypothetical protein
MNPETVPPLTATLAQSARIANPRINPMNPETAPPLTATLAQSARIANPRINPMNPETVSRPTGLAEGSDKTPMHPGTVRSTARPIRWGCWAALRPTAWRCISCRPGPRTPTCARHPRHCLGDLASWRFTIRPRCEPRIIRSLNPMARTPSARALRACSKIASLPVHAPTRRDKPAGGPQTPVVSPVRQGRSRMTFLSDEISGQTSGRPT